MGVVLSHSTHVYLFILQYLLDCFNSMFITDNVIKIPSNLK
nr:MAG TPA: hypothetical protein [Caudoviricetes sp.]